MHIISYSGGKDSTALIFMMIEKRMKIDKIIFADTMLEYPEMYDFIDYIDGIVYDKIGIHITKTKPDKSFDYWFYGHYTRGNNMHEIRGFPKVAQMGCWWNRESKIKPMKKSLGSGNDIYLGIAYSERESICGTV